MGEIFGGSDAYERFMGRWSRQLAPLMMRFASVTDGQAILDCGTGTGALALEIARALPAAQATGVDPSSAYVREAQRRASDGRVRFLVGDVQALPLPDASFDAALSMLVMNFVPDPARALREMTRVTQVNGIVAAAVWDYGAGMEMLRAFWDEAVALDPAARDERRMPLCEDGELAALWRAGGLQQVEDQALTIDLTFASFDDYWSPFLGGQGPAGAYIATLSEDARRALESRLRTRLLSERQDGAFTLRARAWAVRGVVAARAAAR
jgi:SAM-dependent methyltransferase